jgi:hypothetical protein
MPLSAEQQARLNELEEKEKKSLGIRLNPQEQERLAQLEDKEKSIALGTVNKTIKNFFSGAVKPIKRTAQIYKYERESGRELVRQSYQPSREPRLSDLVADTIPEKASVWDRALMLGAGTAQYTFSPVTAVAQGLAGEPAESATKEALDVTGIPDVNVPLANMPVSEFTGKLGENAVYFIPPGKAIQWAMMQGFEYKASLNAMKESDAILKELSKTSWGRKKVPTTKPSKDIPLRSDDIPVTAKPGAIVSPQVKQTLIDDITKASETALAGNFDESKRIFRQISEALRLGEIAPNDLPEILGKNQMSAAQFAEMYAETVSTGGRILGYHSRAKRQLTKVFANFPEASAILEGAFKGEGQLKYGMDHVMQVYGSVENFRRAMLVSQAATALRNMWSQTGRITIGALDDALQGSIRGTVGAQGQTYQQTMEGLNTFVAATNRLSPGGRKRLFEILEQNHAALAKGKLLSQPVHEVALTGKFAHAVNILNRGQEMFFRKVAFESKLRSLLQRKGMNFNTVNPKHIPKDLLEESVNYAMEMTFAASPKSRAMQNFVKAWTNYIPGATTMQPFPRFNVANAVPFIYEHSPLGFLSAMKPSTIKALASGNPDLFAKHASRALIGSMMLDQAIRFRQSDHAGEKWYEIKTGTDEKTGKPKYMDTRAYAPFSTYLFIAEHFANPERIKPKDYAEAFVGLNRIAGSGLVALDWIRARSVESFQKQAANFAGQYLGSFTVPFRTLSDVYSGVDEKEALYRDYRENPWLAPMMQNIPVLSQMIPEKYSPLTTQRLKKGEPMFGLPAGIARQLSGFSQRTKTPIMQEIDRLGMDWSSISPRSGIARADRQLSRYMAPIVEKVTPPVIRSKQYQGLTDSGKRIALAEIFATAREAARARLVVENPSLALKTSITGMADDMERLLKEKLQEQKLREGLAAPP